MNVNGSTFFHLLGRDDWGSSTARFGGRTSTLKSIWGRTSGTGAGPDIAKWSEAAARLTLAEIGEDLEATPGEARLVPANRRAAAVDLYGNLYSVSDDRTSIMVSGAGQRDSYRFWPDKRGAPKRAQKDFADASPDAAPGGVITALAITATCFLVAAIEDGSRRWLLRFDLIGGGEPQVHEITGITQSTIIDLAAGCCASVWLLEASPGRVLRLGPDLQIEAGAAIPSVDALFQPVDGAELRADAPAVVPSEILVPELWVARQLQTTTSGELLVFTNGPLGSAGIFAIDIDATVMRSIFAQAKPIHAITTGPMPSAVPGETALTNGRDDEAIYALSPNGNQAFLYRLKRGEDGLIEAFGPEAKPEPAILPMRRFGGRALILRGDAMVYDSGVTDPVWVPLLVQMRRIYSVRNEIVSRVFDAGEPQTVWDRIRLDATIPPGTDVLIEARAHDDENTLKKMGDAGWMKQPGFYLNSDGGELPGKRAIAQLATDRIKRSGCWDLLLQNVSGRFAQLRITLTGDGRHTPSLRSMRIWYPRFSYSTRFLPALYREEASATSFLDRFLANMEGINSVIEGRVASAQSMFDPRTATKEMLEWLATWFDVMLDPAWDEERRRMFLMNAMEFFGWRGTVQGVKMALRLAFDADLKASDFRFGSTECIRPGSIRIVEAFSVQSRGRHFAMTEVARGDGPQSRALIDAWQPWEGAAGLKARLPEGTNWPGSDSRLPLFAPEGDAGAWTAIVQDNFGFVPAVAAAERLAWQSFQEMRRADDIVADLPTSSVDQPLSELWSGFLAMASRNRQYWQQYLQGKYRNIVKLNAAHSSGWDSFAQISLPDCLPTAAAAIGDWLQFEGQLLPRRQAAHRFSVLIPLTSVNANADELAAKMALAQRIVAIEKPAHTVFDVRLFWAMNRLGEARLGEDTMLGAGSRAPELIPPAILGQAYLGSNFVGGPQGLVAGRERLAC